jgi:hypothetical protein
MILEIIIILGILVVILGYTTFNLLRKNEKQRISFFQQNIFINLRKIEILKTFRTNR